MTLTLYDHPDSTNALKVRFLLAELGLDAELVEVPLDAPRPAAYRDVHPFGLIPALRDGALTITESNTMLRYLAEREGRADLRGAEPDARARVDGLLDSLSLELRPPMWGVEEVAVYGLDVTEEEHAARVAALATALDAYDTLLDPAGPFALGGLTVADFAIAGRLLHLPRLGLAAGVAPRVHRALAAAQALESWRSVRPAGR